MANANHEVMMANAVQTVLQTVNSLATCTIYNLPPHRSAVPLTAAVIPFGLPDDETKTKKITMQVRIRAKNDSLGLSAANALYAFFKDYKFPYPGTSDTDNGVICVAKTTPSYEGVDVAGQPLFGIVFELTSIF